MKKYRVTLTDSEVSHLGELVKKGKRKASVLRNALILLNCNEADAERHRKDEQVATLLGVTVRTIENVRKRFVMEGFETALYGRKSDRVYPSKIDGDVEAHLIALSCSSPPKGYAKWSLRLLSDKMVALRYVETISYETVRLILKKRIKTLERKRVADLPTQQQ